MRIFNSISLAAALQVEVAFYIHHNLFTDEI